MLSISLFLNKVVQDINLHMLWNYFVSLKGIPQEALFYMLYEGKTHLIMKFYFLLWRLAAIVCSCYQDESVHMRWRGTYAAPLMRNTEGAGKVKALTHVCLLVPDSK